MPAAAHLGSRRKPGVRLLHGNTPSLNILILHNSMTFARKLEAHLRGSMHCNVTFTSEPNTALRLLEQSRFHAVICDMVLRIVVGAKIVDGLEFLRLAKIYAPSTPTIILSFTGDTQLHPPDVPNTDAIVAKTGAQVLQDLDATLRVLCFKKPAPAVEPLQG